MCESFDATMYDTASSRPATLVGLGGLCLTVRQKPYNVHRLPAPPSVLPGTNNDVRTHDIRNSTILSCRVLSSFRNSVSLAMLVLSRYSPAAAG